MDSCSDCPVNTYKAQVGASSCTPCPPDTTTNGTMGATAASVCRKTLFFFKKILKNFKKRFFLALHHLIIYMCTTHKEFVEIFKAFLLCFLCTVCPVGKTGSPCSDCPVNTYKDEIGAGSCTPCMNSKTTNGMTGATAASACGKTPFGINLRRQ